MARVHKAIKVLICNKHGLFREGIKSLLREGTPVEIVGETATARQAIELLRMRKPDVVLLDAAMRDLSGSEATRRIKAIDRNVKVLIVSMYDDERLISGCLAAGASGYVRMDSHSVHLRNAITNVCRRSAHAA
jgi:DNA-binding NarL/FixJ family response regulator